MRPQDEGDGAFLERLFLEARWDELTVAGWPEPVKSTFLRSQFQLQHRHYAAHYSDANFHIVLSDGVPIGRLCVHRGVREMRIVDVALLAAWRGAGLGSALLRAVTAEAATGGRTVTLHVDHFNRALTLYRRLGFREKKIDGPYVLMEWSP